MKKSFIIIFCFMSILSVSNAQNVYFNNIYNFYNNQITGISTLKEDTTYVVVSFSIDSLNYSRINFSRFDAEGNLMFKKNYGDGLRDYFPGHSGTLQKVSDGGFIISGAVTDSIGTKAILLKVDQNFDPVFIKEFEDTSTFHYMEFQQGVETSDKGFILGGDIVIASHTQAILLIKTDSLGNQIFRKIFTLSGFDYDRNIIQTPDKGYLLGCYSWNYYSASYSGDPWVLKLDSLGNLKWSNKYGGPNQDGPAIVALANDSNYIITYAYAYFTEPMSTSDLKIEVLKLNKTDGSTIWDKQYDTIRPVNYPNMVKVTENDNIIIVGSTGYWDGVSTYAYVTSWVLKLRPNGDSIYYRMFYKYNDEQTWDNTANDFCINNDYSIVICGDVQHDTTSQCLWLVKMDSMGCLQPGCDPTAGIEEIKPIKEAIRIFPNPATNQTTIAYSQLKEEGTIHIYNLLGQIVYEEKIDKGSSQTKLSIQNYKAGLYKVIVREKGMMIGEVSLVKE